MAKHEPEKGRIINIPVAKLARHPDNAKYFHDIEGEEWDCFKADISEHGILKPILVARNENESYTVLSGHQRLRVAEALLWGTVPSVVWDGDENHRDILFSSNLGRQLTLLERYRLTVHLLDKMEDGRKEHERDKHSRFHHTVKNGLNGEKPRDRVASMVPGVTKHDMETFRKIKELPQPVQQELFKFVEKENPSEKALKVNALNDEKRRLKAALREEKLKLKKKEMEQMEEFVQFDIDPEARYDAKSFDETITAVNKAAVEIPRLIAYVLSFSLLIAGTAEILDQSIDALSKVLFEQGRFLLARWDEHKPPETGENELSLEAEVWPPLKNVHTSAKPSCTIWEEKVLNHPNIREPTIWDFARR